MRITLGCFVCGCMLKCKLVLRICSHSTPDLGSYIYSFVVAVRSITADYIVRKLFSHILITVRFDEVVIRLHFLPLSCLPPITGDNSLPLPLFLRSPRGRFLWSRLRHPAHHQSTTPTAAATSPLSVTSPLTPPPSEMDTTAPRMHWGGLMELMISMEMPALWALAQLCPWTWRTRSAWRCKGRRRRRRKRMMMSAM